MQSKLSKYILILLLFFIVSCDKEEPVVTPDLNSPTVHHFEINNQPYLEDSISLSRATEFKMSVGYTDESPMYRSIRLVINNDSDLSKELILSQSNDLSFSYIYEVPNLEKIVFDDPDNPYITNQGDKIKLIFSIEDIYNNGSQHSFVICLAE